MSGLGTALLAVGALAILLLPRRWAPVALLGATCYVTRAQGIELGPFTFTVVRTLLVIGLLRVLVRREWVAGGLNRLDWLMVLWGIWMVLSVAFHNNASNQLIGRLGILVDTCGTYFLVRCLCHTWKEAAGLCRVSGIVLAPIAAAMLMEKVTAHNLFAVLGGVGEAPYVRNDHVRAQGPFAHAILAGTIGAVCLPLTLSVWARHRFAALTGAIACIAMVFASSSSGPILSAAAGVGALACWACRGWTRFIRWSAVLAYLLLSSLMSDPAYYLMARIDLAGGSTGWHRARLIEVSINQLSEWWLAGTDYTRHWMPTGVSWSPDHTDITNHYLQMGVLGGLPLMALFIAAIWMGFVLIGRGLRHSPQSSDFVLWALGSSLFAHAVTCIAVSYFDQSVVFLYVTLGLIASSYSGTIPIKEEAAQLARRRARRRAQRRRQETASGLLFPHDRVEANARRSGTYLMEPPRERTVSLRGQPSTSWPVGRDGSHL